MEGNLQVGFSVMDITPDNLGFPLYGYSNREKNSEGVHDPLQARSVVFRRGENAWALCVLDLLAINGKITNNIRDVVADQTGLEPGSIMISCIHTHSGPSLQDIHNWNDDIQQRIADGIINAWNSQQPAVIGTGAGFLYGYHLNRRWMERPVDPSVNVIRVDNLDGQFLGLVANFGLHAVVLGYDNFQISSDYVGYTRSYIEEHLGGVVVFANGAAGDVNPITKTVRRQMAEKRAFTTMTGAKYFGSHEAIEFSDRGGGTFEECEEIGYALGDQIVYVAEGITTLDPPGRPWSYQAFVNHLDEGDERIEVMAVGIADFGIVAEPGEILVETGLDLKARMREKGYRFPWVVSYANDWQSYLAPKATHIEGGYEAMMAQKEKHTMDLQTRIWDGLKEGIPVANPMEKITWRGFQDHPNDDNFDIKIM
jgi:neutral ceramidase